LGAIMVPPAGNPSARPETRQISDKFTLESLTQLEQLGIMPRRVVRPSGYHT